MILWLSSLAILAAGAVAACPEGRCIIGEFDRAGLGLAHALRSEWLDAMMQGITWFGSLLLLLPLTAALAWVLLRSRRRREAGFLVLGLLGSSALSHVFKLWVARPRPDLFPTWLDMPGDWSFPSAHAMQATAAALAWLLVAERTRIFRAILLGLAVLLVGLSRIYLQVHFPSDVVVGTLAALLWVAGLHALLLRPAAGGHRKRGEGAA
ncbi:MAG: phosphatase PAP2 family protein [Betaproteobacteria bacterium]|nr:phosphatase PAP2 family protein [Betaproteobacteria bacterium]